MRRALKRRGGRLAPVAAWSAALAAAVLPLAAERPWAALGCGAVLCALAAAIAAEDFAAMLIPDVLTLAVAALGLLALYAEFGLAALQTGAAEGAIAFVAAAGFASIYAQMRGVQALGFGDVKLLGASAVWLGFGGLALQILAASLSALAFALWRSWRRGRPLRARARLPFGAFLAPAVPLVWAVQPWLG
jgi:leader peptidase (prepilin peptidase)/N-methyltransferase